MEQIRYLSNLSGIDKYVIAKCAIQHLYFPAVTLSHCPDSTMQYCHATRNQEASRYVLQSHLTSFLSRPYRLNLRGTEINAAHKTQRVSILRLLINVIVIPSICIFHR